MIEALLKAFEKNDTLQMKEIAEKSAAEALVKSDSLEAKTSIIAYALAKIMEKPRIAKTDVWKEAYVELKDKLRQPSDENLNFVIAEIEKLSRNFGRFMQDAVQKARIKTATQMYAHGASIGVAVQLTGAERIELQSYIGETKIHQKYRSSVKERLANLEKFFQ